VHALNLREIYHDFLRASNEESAEAAVADVLTLGIRERNDMSREFWRTAGRLKPNFDASRSRTVVRWR